MCRDTLKLLTLGPEAEPEALDTAFERHRHVWHVSLGRVADAFAPMFGLESLPVMLAWRYAVAIAGATLVAVLIERPFMALRDIRPSILRSPQLWFHDAANQRYALLNAGIETSTHHAGPSSNQKP